MAGALFQPTFSSYEGRGMSLGLQILFSLLNLLFSPLAGNRGGHAFRRSADLCVL